MTKILTDFASGEQLLTVSLWTNEEQDGRSLSEATVSENEDDTGEDSAEESEQGSNIKEGRNGSLPVYIVCLKEDLRDKASYNKDKLVDIAVERMPAAAQTFLRQLLMEEPSKNACDLNEPSHTDVPFRHDLDLTDYTLVVLSYIRCMQYIKIVRKKIQSLLAA